VNGNQADAADVRQTHASDEGCVQRQPEPATVGSASGERPPRVAAVIGSHASRTWGLRSRLLGRSADAPLTVSTSSPRALRSSISASFLSRAPFISARIDVSLHA